MSVEHMALVLHHSRAVGTAKVILLGIANHTGDGGAFPSLRTLVKYSGVDERSVRRALRSLEELGELSVDVKAGGNDWVPDHLRPNRYEVLVECPPWCDRSAQHKDVRHTDQTLWSAADWGRQRPHPGDVSVPTPGTSASPQRTAL